MISSLRLPPFFCAATASFAALLPPLLSFSAIVSSSRSKPAAPAGAAYRQMIGFLERCRSRDKRRNRDGAMERETSWKCGWKTRSNLDVDEVPAAWSLPRDRRADGPDAAAVATRTTGLAFFFARRAIRIAARFTADMGAGKLQALRRQHFAQPRQRIFDRRAGRVTRGGERKRRLLAAYLDRYRDRTEIGRGHGNFGTLHLLSGENHYAL